MKKRILSVILVLAMLMTGMLFVNVSAATPDQNAEPGSEAYTAWLVAEGYKPITTYAEFAALANTATAHPTVQGRFVIDGKYYLANDIVMENTAYILAEGDFTGSFDGNGHTIYNCKAMTYDFLTGSWKNVTYSKYTSPEKTEEFDTTASIFWGIDNGALMENVINERKFADVSNYWGCFARKSCENATATFINCANYSSIASPYPVNNHRSVDSSELLMPAQTSPLSTARTSVTLPPARQAASSVSSRRVPSPSRTVRTTESFPVLSVSPPVLPLTA